MAPTCSRVPEQQGCLLARDELEADFFVRMNNTGGPVDVWEVTRVDAASLQESPEGFLYSPSVVPSHRLCLVKRDVAAEDW